MTCLPLIFFYSFAIDFANKIIPLDGALNRSKDIPESIVLVGAESLILNYTNSPYCAILNNWVFENFILADEPFANALWIFVFSKFLNLS